MKLSHTLSRSLTDWARIDAMQDEEIDLSECPEITPEMFATVPVRRGSTSQAQIPKLKEVILNIRLDLQQFEAQYQRSTADFYRQFKEGNLEDTEDFLVWAGIYEMLCENERRLEELA